MAAVDIIPRIEMALYNFWNTFVGIVRKFTYKDAIDIILLAVIIYAVVKLVRETRAGQLVKGIIILAVLWFIATRLKLLAMTSFFSYVFQFTWIALLIVFQPEIRNALERMGRSSMGQRLRMATSLSDYSDLDEYRRRAINAVVGAAQEFQQKKVGALIVFERETRLGDIIDTGTIVNADPSVELIGNIFFNKAPLHDGAMIIRNGSIYAAGCILPLTHAGVASELGTRHRAAIGMSEDSDAVVVVVSEETGQISIAVNGVLTRDYVRETLSGRLEELLLTPQKPETKKRGRRAKDEG